ncbi:MAG: NAD(P) transhydrogenase subunit alpha [Candidatus Sumerlaeaceae bacterium]
MIVGVPKETFAGERRVALVPASVPLLLKQDIQVHVQSGAGVEAGFPDQQYIDKGATVVGDAEALIGSADILACVRAGGANPGVELAGLKPGQILIGFLDPLGETAAAARLAATGVTAFAMELIPRITRAQSMDALSSQASIAGYKAVLVAANLLPRMFPMLTTAAGTIAPARVLIMGAGVAGLQAIATARRLGAVVSAYDVRAAAKEQVLSLGARFVELPLETAAAEGAGGYAAAQDEAFYQRQRELIGKVVAESDVLITTAAVPGKRAPVLVSAEHTRRMSPGSVVVDLAAERGGNCELTQSGQTVYDSGVTIFGPDNMPSEVPYHASQLYAKNVSSLILHLVKKGEMTIDIDDEITRETMLCREGAITNARVAVPGTAASS